ncbi:hypothetical protein [Parvularcula sp. LCG005]|uniref:hypothetical protein n=1 Tax=Parvularcula sp. LCG005 TaxID=3078805 RepID=UPI0029429445|nr:hypothetical protein [Parvularcula sp. LCG005]WOI51969.1 hypothetical protein RUI03_07345 [Parvularcula sp. LCG005]
MSKVSGIVSKTNVKTVAMTALGVIIAGAALYYLGKYPVFKQASDGLDGKAKGDGLFGMFG